MSHLVKQIWGDEGLIEARKAHGGDLGGKISRSLPCLVRARARPSKIAAFSTKTQWNGEEREIEKEIVYRSKVLNVWEKGQPI